MKRLAAALLASLLASTASAACVGSGLFQTCTDSSGNTYTVQRMGNQTTMQGYNPSTGSNWSQQSNTFGGTTIVNGNDSQGRTWNNTIQNMGGGYVHQSGMDASGRPFSRVCGPLGCN